MLKAGLVPWALLTLGPLCDFLEIKVLYQVFISFQETFSQCVNISLKQRYMIINYLYFAVCISCWHFFGGGRVAKKSTCVAVIGYSAIICRIIPTVFV